MPPPYTGREIVKALNRMGFAIVDRTGSHVKLRYEHPENPDDIRVVSVPMGYEIPIGTLQKIADQSGAQDFNDWCEWVDEIL